jgi:hypothetical protein
LTGGDKSSSISSTTGGSLNVASTSLSSAVDPVGTGSSALPNMIPTQSAVVISGSPSLINNPNSTNGPTSAGPNNNVPSALADPHHQLSSGGIAAIIVVVLVLFVTLPITVIILRRRSKIHRVDRRTKWWFATTRASQLYGDGVTEQLIPPGTQTARSSFGTTIDHSESNPPTYVIPPFPPAMAEMGRGNASRPALVINLEGNGNNNLGENRYSTGSAGSDHSQYLIINHRSSANTEAATPMSVRPFSPSESFAFPKPPEPVVAGSVPLSAVGSPPRPMSIASAMLITPPLLSLLPPGLPSTPSYVPFIFPNTRKSPSPITNPFEDPTTPTIDNSSSYLNTIPVEVVRRPFEPTLPDELAVELNDRVRVLHRYDDGWGLVEMVGREEERGVTGVIPMDCLRTVEELEELETGTRSSSSEGLYAF